MPVMPGPMARCCAGLCRVFSFFFFSSRRRHTRFDCDWSSDVCSSDLVALLAPLMVLASPRPAAPSHEVVTAVDIDAPPAVVWRHVVTFPELPPPPEWLFRARVAAPPRAPSEGNGVGGTRDCDFPTGRF